jgi:glycosyltransferase involved in cell wall biosynthesis
MKITVLYSEMAEYTIACLKQLALIDNGIQLVHWPINPEAPFKFDLSFCEVVISRESTTFYDLLDSVRNFNPDLILCSGWMDRDYVKVCNHFKGDVPTILSMDNHWEGSLKQHIARLVSPFTIQKAFSHAFVPGHVQENYALKLGFDEKQIKLGFYSADTSRFDQYFDEIGQKKLDQFPKRFLFLGRYVKHKGVSELWEAFQKVHFQFPDWELWCVGTGDQYEERVERDGIKHFGFVQPSDLKPILAETGVYILPSHFEPWGVSVQELAISGFPLILSSAIGSKEQFLEEPVNGYEFQAESAEALSAAMIRICLKSDEELITMGAKSRELGFSNSPTLWAEKLLSFLRDE